MAIASPTLDQDATTTFCSQTETGSAHRQLMTISITTAAAITTGYTTARTAAPSRTRRRWRLARTVSPTTPAPVEFTWANRRPGTPGFARWTAALGQRIEAHGLGPSARDVDSLVDVARRVGAAPTAVDVLADPLQAEPARCRAFAIVVSALTADRVRVVSV